MTSSTDTRTQDELREAVALAIERADLQKVPDGYGREIQHDEISDWGVFLADAALAAMSRLRSTPPAHGEGELEKAVGVLTGYYQPSVRDADFVNVCNGDLRKLFEARALSPSQDAGMVEAATAAQSWLDNWAQHVGTCPDGEVCTCGLQTVREQLTAALARNTEGRE